jgi:hypothetical protein
MIGMGLLRLNKLVAKQKWNRKEAEEEETQDGRESSLAPWLVVMALLVISILIFRYMAR